MFAARWSALLGVKTSAIDELAAADADSVMALADELLGASLPTVAHTEARLRDAGITQAVVHGPLPSDVPYRNEATADVVAQAPDTLIGFARVDPTTGDEAGAEVLRCARDLGMRGVTITPFWHGVSCDEPRVEPIFEAAQEAGIPVWVHTSVNWVRDRPIDLEHPRHIDVVAARFPNVSIICGHGGWPWVQEAVAVAWRHPNVYLDISAFRPRHLFVTGSGWEALAYYGGKTISSRLLFGTTWTLLGMTPEVLVEEARAAPWDSPVVEAWLSGNGHRIFSGD
jgi:predicted TIM-barrel fold metal-dependent hydrolase